MPADKEVSRCRVLQPCAISDTDAGSGSPPHAAQIPWRPAKNVEIIVGVGRAAGVDRTARTLQKILQDRQWLEVSSAVVNKPGGGGTSRRLI